MRDSQRSKLYKAERVLQEGDIRLETVKEMTAFLDKLLNSAWFRRRWPWATVIRVKDGRARRRAGASSFVSGGEITMPVWSRYRYIVLHELAHILREDRAYSAAHGPEFCKTYLELVRHCMGDEAWKKLRTSMKANRVKWITRRATFPKGQVPPHLLPYQKKAAGGSQNE